jgi:hypothetical protein
MPDFCSCGAQLPDDARFCHKCGKPQRDEIVVEQPPAPPAAAAAQPLPDSVWPGAPSFHHPVAVRVGLFVASIATFLCLALPFGFVIWLPSAGFTSVYLFSRRTGQSLSVRNGARMGWISGILSFLIITVLFTIIATALASRTGGLAGFFREQLSAQAVPSISRQDLDKAIDMLANPVDQAVVYLFFLLVWFTVISVFCTAGGAIGAKVLARE